MQNQKMNEPRKAGAAFQSSTKVKQVEMRQRPLKKLWAPQRSQASCTNGAPESSSPRAEYPALPPTGPGAANEVASDPPRPVLRSEAMERGWWAGRRGDKI